MSTPMTKAEIDALPVGSVVMTETDPETFGVYEQRVWMRHGGHGDWQFPQYKRHDWQATDGGFQRMGEQYGSGFACNRIVTVLYRPDQQPRTEAAVRAGGDQ